MARGYDDEQVKERLINLLSGSKTGLSGVEISAELGINRVTMTKFLNVFAAEGIIKQKNIGNVNLWLIEEGIEHLKFPDDYFRVQEKYLDFLIHGSESAIYNLIRNCISSNADVTKLMTEVIIPTITQINLSFDDGKIGKSEQQFMNGIISKSNIAVSCPVPYVASIVYVPFLFHRGLGINIDVYEPKSSGLICSIPASAPSGVLT